VTNPLPPAGGRDRESSEHARRFGPDSVQSPLVAVTADDYTAAALAFTDAGGRRPIGRAQASFRWTGSWLTVTLAADRADAGPIDGALRASLLAYLDTRRLAGYDLALVTPRYVPVDLAIDVVAAPGATASDVEQAVRRALAPGTLPGGKTGFFDADNFNFGDALYLSRVYATVLAVAGVASATVTRLARLRSAQTDLETAANLRQGFLAVGDDEIVRLDDDRNFPEDGTLEIRMNGGAS
jgi:predicted phage baseplate assembly protein